MNERIVTVVFKSFTELNNLYDNFFVPYKELRAKSDNLMYLSGKGRILWLKLRFILYWKLGRVNRLPKKGEKVTFAKLINLAKNQFSLN